MNRAAKKTGPKLVTPADLPAIPRTPEGTQGGLMTEHGIGTFASPIACALREQAAWLGLALRQWDDGDTDDTQLRRDLDGILVAMLSLSHDVSDAEHKIGELTAKVKP